jgi:hypothetical protein
LSDETLFYCYNQSVSVSDGKKIALLVFQVGICVSAKTKCAICVLAFHFNFSFKFAAGYRFSCIGYNGWAMKM